MNNQKSQISIFIIISVLIIILFFFLINFNYNQKNQTLKQSSSSSKITTPSKLFPLSDSVNFCLSLELKKALIIAGSRGGFIYNDGEYYSRSIDFSKFYSPNLISNLNINWNYLGQNILISGQYYPYIPNINSSVSLNNGITVYNNSITTEFNNYILSNFLNCLDLGRYVKAGYNIERLNFSGNVTSVSSKTITVSHMNAKVGDNVLMILQGKFYYGKVISNSSIITVKMDQTIPTTNVDLTQVVVRNLNSSTYVKVTFDKNQVTAHLNFPIKISSQNFSTSFTSSVVTVDSRFKSLLDLEKYLLFKKYQTPSINLNNYTEVNNLLQQSSGIFSGSKSGLTISRTVLNNSENYKLYVYSIIDNASRLFGTPYVFNFAFEDHAPYLIPNGIPNSYIGNLNFVTSTNNKFNLSLGYSSSNNGGYVRDKELIGNYNYFCIPQFISSPAYTFSLSKNCTVNFEAYKKGYYPFNIYLTDGFVKRSQTISYFTGFGDNKDNTQARDCFKYNNYQYSFFPISYKYSSQVYNSTTNAGYENLFAYFLNIPSLSSFSTVANIDFNNGCLYRSNLYEAKYRIKNLANNQYINGWQTMPTGGLNIPNSFNYPIQIVANVFDKTSGQEMVANDYTINLYPANCLGPNSFNVSSQILYGGKGSCCDLTQLPTTSLPSTSLIKNVLNSGSAINANMYFGFIPGGLYSSYNYSNNNIWAAFGNDATTLYEGKVQAVCKGVYPEILPNVNSISAIGGSTKSFTVKNVFSGTRNISKTLSISLSVANSGGVCNFNIFSNTVNGGVVLSNGLALTGGLVSMNPSSTIYSGPLTYSNFDWVKCSNTYVESSDGNSWQPLSLNYGKGTFGSIYVSGQYCSVGTTSCNGYLNSPGSKTIIDSVTFCEDSFVSSTTAPNFFSTIPLTGTQYVCAQGKTCNNGVCT